MRSHQGFNTPVVLYYCTYLGVPGPTSDDNAGLWQFLRFLWPVQKSPGRKYRVLGAGWLF